MKPKDISYKVRQIQAFYKVALSYEAIKEYKNALTYINKAIKQLNKLRVIAHVIDMHQLTKSPTLINTPEYNTESSPKRLLNKFELGRYLNYSSEMTDLIAKVAALYAQSLPEQDVVQTVHEIEVLCTGISQKVWLKLNILNNQ